MKDRYELRANNQTDISSHSDSGLRDIITGVIAIGAISALCFIGNELYRNTQNVGKKYATQPTTQKFEQNRNKSEELWNFVPFLN